MQDGGGEEVAVVFSYLGNCIDISPRLQQRLHHLRVAVGGSKMKWSLSVLCVGGGIRYYSGVLHEWGWEGSRMAQHPTKTSVMVAIWEGLLAGGSLWVTRTWIALRPVWRKTVLGMDCCMAAMMRA